MIACPWVTNDFAAYNMQADSWSELASAPTNRTRYQVETFGDNILYIGGRDGNDSLISHIDIYTISTNTWHSVHYSADAAAPHLRSDGETFLFGDLVYLVGGYDVSYAALNSTVVLNISSESTIAQGFQRGIAADKPTAAGDIGAQQIGNYVYVFGGYGSDWCRPLSNLERYDPVANSWTTLANMKHGRGDMAHAAAGSVIYVIGGEGKASDCGQPGGGEKSFPLNEVESFDTSDLHGAWKDALPIEKESFRFAGSAFNHTLFIIGGMGHEVVPADAPHNAAQNSSYYGGYYPVLREVYAHTIENGAVSTLTLHFATLIATIAAALFMQQC